MNRLAFLGSAALLLAPSLCPRTAIAQTPPARSAPAPASAAMPLTYADVADLVLAAPVIADVTIRSASKLKPAEAPGLAAGRTRYYVEADVGALLRGPGALPSRIGYLLDVVPDAGGRQPKLRKMRVLLFARPTTQPGQVQLVAPDAQVAWSAPLDALVRQVATASIAPDAPPRVTGIGNAFHVAGALPGEGETQVFLQTANGAPVSLSILRRPGEQPRWAVALSEIVDDAAGPPQRDTLLWYRLACALPRLLPASSTQALAEADAALAAEDYRYVLTQLGPCTRARQPVAGG